MKLFVNNTRAGGHPLHIAFFDHAATAGGIAVRHFAVVSDGDGFKPFVRVLADTARMIHATRGELARCGVIQH